jgi:lysophospholipase L1-like esterase
VEGTNWGVGSSTVASHRATVDASIAAYAAALLPPPQYVLLNLGINDVAGGLPAEATWNANLAYILDAYHAAWPLASVYVAKPWGRTWDTGCDTVATRIDTVLSTRGTWAYVGDDERAWLKAADNGATMTSDGIHYSAAGVAAKVAAVMAVLP